MSRRWFTTLTVIGVLLVSAGCSSQTDPTKAANRAVASLTPFLRSTLTGDVHLTALKALPCQDSTSPEVDVTASARDPEAASMAVLRARGWTGDWTHGMRGKVNGVSWAAVASPGRAGNEANLSFNADELDPCY